MKILLVDNYDSFTYNLAHIVEAQDGCDLTVIRNDAISADDAKSFDKIILSPGPGIPEEAGNMPQIVSTLAGVRPLLGICLGHQCIGEHFGATLDNITPVMHGQETPISLDATHEPLFEGLPSTVQVGRYHSWIVSKEDLPEELLVTATDASGQIMALRHRELDIVGFQFHPESVMTEVGPELLRRWVQGGLVL